MLNKIIKFSLTNRLMVVAASALLLIYGTYTASDMEVDVFPDLTAPTVVVLTEAHGMAPEEVERLVTKKIETAVNGATDVRRVRSSSAVGISIVWVEFEWDTDIMIARQIVSEKLSAVKLPLTADRPVLAPQSSIMGEIMLIGVTSDSTNIMDLRTIADWNIRPRLLSIAGVSQVVVIGGEFKQYQLLASPQKMNHYDVTLEELTEAAEEASRNSSGGFFNEYSQEYVVTGVGQTNDPAELAGAVIKVVNDMPITIGDVAEVKIGAKAKIGDGSINSQPAVVMTVMKQPGTNTLELTEQIDQAMAELSNSLPADVEINTKIFRQADFINASISNIKKTLIEGSIFVMVILVIFLMNFRATLISLLAIPISLIVAILVLKWFGFTINTMSLGGMAIAIGDLVDDAIIDVENVFRRLKENALLAVDKQRKKLDVIFDASTEIRTSVINATFIIITAFIPLFFLSGMEGKLLAPLGIAFIVALFASLVTAITLTPVLCSFLLTGDKMLKKQHKDSWLVVRLNRWYEHALVSALKLKFVILGTAAVLFIGALIIMSGFGRSFLPEFNEGSLVVSVVSMPGISLEESNKIGIQVENALRTVPEIQMTTRRTGRAELDEHAQGVNSSEVEAPFTLTDRSREDFMADVREKLDGVTGANITIGQPIGHRIDHMLSGTRANIAIKVFGTDLNRLFKISNQIKTEIEGISGLVDISVEQQVEVPLVKIIPRRMMLKRYGISIGEFNEFIDIAFAGEQVGEIYEGDRSFDLLLKYNNENRGSINNMRKTLINTHRGGIEMVPFEYVAHIVSASGPNTINREKVQRKVVVSANVTGRDQKSAVDEIKAKLDKAINVDKTIELPQNYHLEYGGQFEAEAAASKTLLTTSLIAILVIFFLLYQEFQKVSISAIILINLPLALIGGVMSIYFTSGIISIPAIIGFITLFGIATRNGILLVSHYITLQNEGMGLKETIIRGSIDRLSPILMTALTAGLALIPLALASDMPGNEIQSPMAKVILGGLLSSTLLNLFVVPVVYYLVNRKKSVTIEKIVDNEN
jgi:CzcA family heavy metal efflux pump